MTISTQTFLAINVGTSANDGTGDDLRTAFQKVNANFGWMGNTGFNAANVYVAGALATNNTHVETGYQQVKPTANTAVTVNTNVNRVLAQM
jgi:hypothetical protein